MYLYSYPSTHGIPGLTAGGAWEQVQVHLKLTMGWTQKSTLRLWSSEFGDALGGRCGVNSEMHCEAVIEQVWRCNWRPRLSDLRDALGGCDRAIWEMHFDPVIRWVWTCNWIPRLNKLSHPLCGRDRASLEMHLYQAMIERDWRSTWTWSIWRRARCWDSIHWIVNWKQWEYDEVTWLWKILWRTGWWQSIGWEVDRNLKGHSGVNLKLWEWRDDRQSQVNAVLGVCCTWCMLYLVYAALSPYSW